MKVILQKEKFTYTPVLVRPEYAYISEIKIDISCFS